MQLLSLYRPLAFLTFFLSAACAATAGNPPVALPYEGDFEAAEGFSAGPLLSHSQWNFEAGLEAEILPFGAYGDQSLGFSGEHWLWLDTLGLPTGEVTWVDFYLLPVFAGASQLPQQIQTAQSAVTGFVQFDTEGEVYALDGDGQGSGQWLASGQRTALSGNSSQDWLRLTYRLDYANKRWDLFVDGRMALTDLGFLDNTVLQLTEFAFFGDYAETSVLDYFYLGGSNPLYPDSSNDGLLDAWLAAQGLDILVNQRGGDGDADGLDNLTEYQKGTRADLADSDGDGVEDGQELTLGLDPNQSDSDHDGVMDGTELASGLDPRHPDSDRDGLSDGLSDGTELSLGTDPLLFDTDADGLADSLEAVWNLDPLTADAGLATLSETGPGIFEWRQMFTADQGFVDGPLDGQQSWQAQGSATVAGGQVELSASSTSDASFSRMAGIGENRQIWVGFRARLVAGPLPDLSTRAEPAVAAWGAAAPDTIAIWDEAAGQWVEYAAPADLTEWNDYSLFFDYEARQWQLSQNGVLIADELDFFDDDLVVFSRFKALQAQVSGASSPDDPQSAAFSDFVISTAEPTASTEEVVANTQQVPQEEIQNGDFSTTEGPSLRPNSPGWDYYDAGGVPGWEAIEGAHIELQTFYSIEPGDAYAELVAHPGPDDDYPDGHTGLRQTVGTQVGQTYLLRFDCAAHPWHNAADSNFSVEIDDVKIEVEGQSSTVEFSSTNTWQTRIFAFEATSDQTKIEFIPDGISGFIDNVQLLKVDLDSKDRMLGGSLDLSMFGSIKDEIGLQFDHKTTGETFGIYDIGNPDTDFHIYDSEDDLLSDEQMDEYDQGNLDANAYEQDVVFIRDADNVNLINFYTTFEATGEVEVIITKSGTELAKVTHELTEDTDFGEILEHVDARIDQPEITSVTLPADIHPDDFNFDSDFSDSGSGSGNDLITLHRPGTINYPGSAVSEADETTASNLLLSINDDNDEGGPAGQQDNRDTSIHPADDDLTKVVLRLPQGADLNSGSFTLSSNALGSIRIFAADGQSALTSGDLTLNLAAPSGPLASLASTGTATLWVEGLSEFGDIYLRATHTAADSTSISDQAHFQTVGSLAWNYYFPFEQGAGSAVADIDGSLQRVRFSAEGEDILLLTPEYSAVGQRPVRKRNLSTSANVPLFKYLKTGGQLASNYAKGFIDGAWDGAKSDYEALSGIPGTVKDQLQAFYDNPIKAAKAVIDPIRILIDMSNEERLQLVDTMLANFMSNAEENTAWSMELGDAALDYYVSGYITGLASEKLVVMAMGVGVVTKFAQGFKYVLNLSKSGQAVVSTVSAANKFKTAAVRSLGRFVTDKTKMREIQEFVMVRLERLNFGNKNTHEVIQEAIDGLDDTKVNHMILGDEFRAGLPDLNRSTAYAYVFYKRLAHVIHTVGPENVSEDMILGFARLNARLVKSDPGDVLRGNRYNDLIALFDADNSAAGKASLAKSLEAYETATDADIDAKFFVTDIDQVHSKVYHHFSAGSVNRLTRDANGNITLTENLSPTQNGEIRGWYVTPDKFDTQASAYDRLQLFNPEDARYRIEIDTSDVNNNLRVARGDGDLEPNGKIESLTRDDPNANGGSGGAKQLLLDGSSAPAGDQIFDTVEGRYLTHQEITNLLS